METTLEKNAQSCENNKDSKKKSVISRESFIYEKGRIKCFCFAEILVGRKLVKFIIVATRNIVK